MKQTYNLRSYEEKDIPSILLVIKEAFAEYRNQLIPPTSAEAKTIEIVKSELEEANALIVEMDKRIIGCVFYQGRGNSIYLDRLSILPRYRKRGIGTALINEVENQARKLSYHSLLLSVRISLKKQQQYYNNLGFEFFEYGTHEGFTEPTSIKMKKNIIP